MKERVLLLHGWGGTHPLHWQQWLEKELQKKGIETVFPKLPNAMLPEEKEWIQEIFKTMKTFDSQTILVGHSLGVPTILRVLEQLPENQKVCAAFLVAGFCRDFGIPEIQNFVNRPFDWKKIRSNCQKFVAVYSDNDPYIPVKESLFLAKQLEINPLLEKNAGHITAPDFGPYPRLLKLVLSEFKK